MVKNRNSQTRLEESAARRKEGKDRKKRSEERRQFKQQAQDFLKKLDSCLGSLAEYERAVQLLAYQNEVASEPPVPVMHLWTDIPGTHYDNGDDDNGMDPSRRLVDDFSSSSNKSAKRRDRSASLGNQQDTPPPLSCTPIKGRSRSNSVPSEAYAYNNLKKGKGKHKNNGDVLLSNSCNNGNKIPEEPASTNPLLCRSHFFLGKCPHHTSSSSSSANSGGSGRKKTTCRYSHFRTASAVIVPQQFSICQALYKASCNTIATNTNKRGDVDLHRMAPSMQQELQLSDRAAAEALPDNLKEMEMDSMEMVYHHTLPMNLWMNSSAASSTPLEDNETTMTGTNSLSGKVCSQIQDRDLSLANVVYVSLGNALLYDRHRDGWLLSSATDDLWATVLGVKQTSILMRRKESIGSEYSQEEVEDIVMHLPGIALEHILTFLPDRAVSAVSRVCRAWNQEIGQNSPNLWRQLLERRQWPVPAPLVHNVLLEERQRSISFSENDESDLGEQKVPSIYCHNLHQRQTHLYRDAFIKHYTMVRNVRAVKDGLAALMSKKSPPAGAEYEMAYQDFSARESAPVYPNQCVALQVWSDNRVLAAYVEDCSLRLFETGPSTSTNGDNVVCREAIFQCIDPSRHTKRKKCRLSSMNLDDHYVVSLLQQHTVGEGTLRPLLVVMSRERFLLGDEAATVANKEYHCIVDIGETVLSYLLENSELLDPHCLQRLLQYFEDGGEIQDLEVKVSRSIGALGRGLFLLEVGIFDILHTSHHFLDRKLVLLSVDSGLIVWVGESLPDTERNATFMAAPALDVCISCSPPGTGKDNKDHSSCTVTVSSPYSSAVLVGSLKLGGLEMKILDTTVYPTEPSSDEEGRIFSTIRLMAVSRHSIVSVDTLRREVDNVQSRMGATMSFYQSSPDGCESGCTTVKLDGDLKCGSFICLDDDHALLLCHQYYSPSQGNGDDSQIFRNNPVATAPRPAGNEHAGEFDLENEDEKVEVVAIIIDIASQREIHRECWFSAQCFRGSWFYELPTATATRGSTLAATISTMTCGGIIMTGDTVRAANFAGPLHTSDNAVVSPRTPRKKKKSKNARSSKKDGLVQGKRMYF